MYTVYVQLASYRSENAKLHIASMISSFALYNADSVVTRIRYSAIARALGVPRDAKARYLKAL